MRLVRWNLTPQRRMLEDADVLVVSPGKAGRTWLRVLLHKYLALHYGVPFALDEPEGDHPSLPAIRYFHELAAHARDEDWKQRLLGRSVLPERLARERSLVLLYRDPRDVVVSSFFHKTRRKGRELGLDLAGFVRHPRYGVAGLVWILNAWRARFRDHPRCLWLRYEDMREDAARELRRILAFLELEVDEAHVAEAVAFASFDRMKQAERRGELGELGHARVSPGEEADPESFKVRRGKVGGYTDYLEGADREFADRAIARLDPFFGYK